MGMADDVSALKSGVYRIDLGNGWYYVGASHGLARRESQHHSELRRGIHCNKIVQNIYNKYQQFSFTVLERCATGLLVAREQALLNEHCRDPKCANIALVVGKPTAGRKLSDDHRAKLCTSATGRKHSAATRAKIGAVQTGKKLSDETRSRMSAAAIGKKKRPFTAEHRAAIGLAKTGIRATDATRAKMSTAATGRKKTPEHRAAISACRAGIKHSAATRAKLSAATTAYWARAREAAATT